MVAGIPGLEPSLNGSIKTNGSTHDHSKPAAPEALNIVIVGAGIGGLVAAIAFRQQGHKVVILEQWDGGNETGAAIHLAPNSNGILRRLGLKAENFGANPMTRLTEYESTGKLLHSIDLVEPNKMWQHPWQLVHRIHLHRQLSAAAIDKQTAGTPADLRYASKVVDIDPATATVTLASGERIQGDVVIGADGVSSQARKKVKGGHIVPFSSGKSAFRFLVSRKEVQEDERTKKFAQREGELVISAADDRKVVVYPCQNNELLNFICIHPDAETSGVSPDETWNAGGSKQRLLEVYSKFDESIHALLSKVDPASLKVWKLLDMEKLPTWINDKLALLGDAAHPFLPHQGQGGGVAMEDAASLAVVLPLGTKPSEVADRLKVYEKCRYERAHRIQEYTRIAGLDRGDPRTVDMMAYTMYNFGHDEWDHSTKVFDEWRWSQNPELYWRMPVSFGPSPGPRQTTYTYTTQPARHSTFTTASIKFKTSRTFLQNLFPSKSFSFSSPGTVAYASFSQTSLRKMEWLGGSGYNHLGLYIHGTKYTQKDGTVLTGTYLPLLFENLTDPIVTGREELGMPKVFCTIDVRRRLDSYRIRAGWQGAMFGKFNLDGLQAADASTDKGIIGGEADNGIFSYKYSPAVGERGKADAEYAVFTPHIDDVESRAVPCFVEKVWSCDSPSFSIDTLTEKDLPTLHHIVSKLAQIPVYEYVSAKVVEGYGVSDVGAARRIE